LCLAVGRFGAAAIVIAVASLGDALDGRIARATQTASPGGALFDSSVDRYEELFVLGGLAYFFRASAGMLVTVLFAIAGSFMVSYGSAKAEALGVPVPGGIMRRTERAVIVCAGIALVPVAAFFARQFVLPGWVETAPIAFALVLVAVGGNLSAVARLRVIAREAGRRDRATR
jgi:CDP-diacylglycerol--glycerol-3-phosphate 3-phosphatidyltransferase